MHRVRSLVSSSRLHRVAARVAGVLLSLAFVFAGLQSPLRGLVPRAVGSSSEEEDPSETGASEKISELRVEALLNHLERPRALPPSPPAPGETLRADPPLRLAVRCRRPAVLRLLI